jgi:hypothetical protein
LFLFFYGANLIIPEESISPKRNNGKLLHIRKY